ncbi:helix-turn-helix domain-containing protein [Glutamicibacter mysorens]
MHELGRYLQSEIDRRGWTIAELARRASISRQTLYSLINDNRDLMDQTPQRKTVNAIADALGVDPVEILTASAKALGVPVEAQPLSDNLDHLSDQQILLELATRLSRSKGQDNESMSTDAISLPRKRDVAPEGDARPRQKIDSLTPDGIRIITTRENRRLRREESNYIAGMTQGHAYAESLREQGKSPQEVREALIAMGESIGEELAELRAAGKAIEKEETAGKHRFGRFREESSQGSITELHGDEARNIPVPPREQLAAHPKVKTKREQLDEETNGESDDQLPDD